MKLATTPSVDTLMRREWNIVAKASQAEMQRTQLSKRRSQGSCMGVRMCIPENPTPTSRVDAVVLTIRTSPGPKRETSSNGLVRAVN